MEIELSKPVVYNGQTMTPNIDKVCYLDLVPWPTTADGGGMSLQRYNRSVISYTASNWVGAAPTPLAINSAIYSTLAIWSESPLPPGVLCSAYSFPFVRVGGTAPFTWTLSGGSLPPGITLTSGVLQGTPTATGTYNFTVQVTDTASGSASQAFTMVIPFNDVDSDGMPDEWESANGLTVGINDSAMDPDHDGQSNLAEFLAGTNPQSAASVLRITSVTTPSANHLNLSWTCVTAKTYRVWSTPDLKNWTALSPTYAAGSTGTLSANLSTSGSQKLFYRVSVVP